MAKTTPPPPHRRPEAAPEAPPPRRRGLLSALGAAAAVAAPAAAALAQTRPAARDASPHEPHRMSVLPPGMARKETEEEKRKPRYRETEHVRAFYRTNRY
jgi:hypothetical protein